MEEGARAMIIGPIIVVIASFFLFWVIEKIIRIIDHRQERKTARLRDELMVAEASAKRDASRYYRARTWEVIRNNQRGGRFTEEDVRALEDMGLHEYLKDDTP